MTAPIGEYLPIAQGEHPDAGVAEESPKVPAVQVFELREFASSADDVTVNVFVESAPNDETLSPLPVTTSKDVGACIAVRILASTDDAVPEDPVCSATATIS